MPDSKQRGGAFSWPWNKKQDLSWFDSKEYARIRARAEFDRSFRERCPYISDSELDLRWKNGEGEEILTSLLSKLPKQRRPVFVTESVKKLIQFLLIVAGIGVVSAIVIPLSQSGYAKWELSREENRKAEEHQKREAKKQAIATSASLAGMFWASALRQCYQIGMADVRLCASHEALLIQERVAVESAKLAVKTVDEYAESCMKVYSSEHCNALVNRAMALSFNSTK